MRAPSGWTGPRPRENRPDRQVKAATAQDRPVPVQHVAGPAELARRAAAEVLPARPAVGNLVAGHRRPSRRPVTAPAPPPYRAALSQDTARPAVPRTGPA